MPAIHQRRPAPRVPLAARRSALWLLLWGAAAAAQAPGGEVRRVEGRVLRGTGDGERPVAGQAVVLHRIASDSAGPVDSMRTGRDGSYRFTYRAAGGDDRTMYLVSTRYAGIAYFTSPLSAAVVTGDSATVFVYDTTSSGPPLVARGRHFIVSPPEATGNRRVVDVFEVANESAATRVAGSNPHGTWRIRLPDGATNPQLGQGDIPADAARFDQGNATLFAPFSPGIRQVVLTYELPPAASPLVIPFDQPVSTLEILVEGTGASASGPVERQEGVALEGRQFDRFLGQDLQAGATVSLALPGGRADLSRLRTLALVSLAALALTLGIVSARRRDREAAAGPAPEAGDRVVRQDDGDADRLARAIAALDAAHAARPSATPDDVAAYQRQRAELKERLVSALAAVDEVTTAQ